MRLKIFVGIVALFFASELVAGASTVSTFDVLQATGTLISNGTATVAGNAFSVGASTFVVDSGTITFGGLLRRQGNTAWGTNAFTHTNLGTAGATGEQAQNWSYATVGGGVNNQAKGQATTVGGGESNFAAGTHATASGGSGNLAQGQYSTAGGGLSNIAFGDYSRL